MDEGEMVVNDAETTAVDSTPTQQTLETVEEAPEKAETTLEGDEGDNLEEPKTVPYERFAEKNEEAKKAREYERQLVELEKQLEKYKGQAEVIEKFQKSFKDEELPPELKRADDELQKLRYLKEDQAREMIRQELQAQRQEQESKTATERLHSEVRSLEEKYDGSNGLPKFDRKEIADYLDNKGYTPEEFASGKITLEEAYKLMYSDQLVDAKAKQKRGTVASEKPGQPVRDGGRSVKDELESAAKKGSIEDALGRFFPNVLIDKD